jgi:predicted alpha-1,6-mannanase (GH76 family)
MEYSKYTQEAIRDAALHDSTPALASKSFSVDTGHLAAASLLIFMLASTAFCFMRKVESIPTEIPAVKYTKVSAPSGKRNTLIFPPVKTANVNYKWKALADSLQKVTYQKFISGDGKYFIQNSAGNTDFNYWWNAHALDVLVDAYQRTQDAHYKQQMVSLLAGIKEKNNGSFPNDYYDDMGWLALSSLRAYSATNETSFLETTTLLWEDIQGGWNTNQGGGIAWRKSQLDYKNTPANGPAVILAARLYRLHKKAEDLTWAKKIYGWLKNRLVDPATGLVWDGINREGNGRIDKHWKFTYNQGLLIGAALELYKTTGEPSYLNDAIKTADYMINDIGLSPGGVLKDEGKGDAGLFKGIFVRYLALLLQEAGLPAAKRSTYQQFLKLNAETLYRKGILRPALLIDSSWIEKPAQGAAIDCSTQLSGLMLIEAAASGRW